MLKSLILLLIVLFTATPLVAFLSFHGDCSNQICHMLMSNLFTLTSMTIVSVIFLTTQLANKVSLLGTLYYQEIFLPPRFL